MLSRCGRVFVFAPLLAIILSTNAWMNEPTNAEEEPVRVFLFAGQSNMVGADAHPDRIDEYPDSLGGGASVSSDWEPLGPVGEWAGFGPELSFGAAVRPHLPKKERIVIVKFTHSGAQGPDWSPAGSPESRRNLYPKLIEFVSVAQADLNRQGMECQLSGVFWHTGENDTYYGPYAQNLAKWLKQLIDRTRTDWQTQNLRWFVSEQSAKSPWKNQGQVNAALRELAQTDPNLVVISTDSLPHGKNLFGAEGIVRLGEAYAKAYLDAKP